MDNEHFSDFNLFFSISVLTDLVAFDRIVRAQGVPEHDYRRFDWQALESEIRELLIQTARPEQREGITLTLWPDTLDSASKPLLEESHIIRYMQTVFSRLHRRDFRVSDLRDEYAVTPINASSPAQEFFFHVEIKGGYSGELIESFCEGICTHFLSGFDIDPLMLLQLFVQYDGEPPFSLSPEMHNLLNRGFDNPFDNNVTLLLMNELQMENFVQGIVKGKNSLIHLLE
ncbi:MAG: hypothetical protein JAZ02_20265 [Candidatus Thiodiazotropha endolucinida]|nr:hypothetical protein [Candidatus Thiodiazotropha taylori]MCG8026283.1 hypothetical protein [Candidatus Thiodiazotropha endolucinida]MCW4268097.1 hypothetical protein [Candidatus Thiodiazotropha endolucinida]